MKEFAGISKSYEISYAGAIATELAAKRKRKAIGCEEYFAAIYFINREILLPYWTEPRLLDEFVRNVCGAHEPIWFYWVELSQGLKTRKDTGIMATASENLAIILNYAAKAAASQGSQAQIKEITVDHLMLAFASHPDLQFVREMFAYGFRRTSSP